MSYRPSKFLKNLKFGRSPGWRKKVTSENKLDAWPLNVYVTCTIPFADHYRLWDKKGKNSGITKQTLVAMWTLINKQQLNNRVKKKKKKESKTKKKRRSAHLLSRQYTNHGMFCYLMISSALGLDIHICSLLQYWRTCDCSHHLTQHTR